jgi:hypothetical protein
MRTLSNPKIGDIVRYGGGSTALAKLTGRHAGGWHGDQCMGGGTFISEPFYEPDCEDLAIWADQQRQQDMRYGPKRSQLSFKDLRKINEQRCNESFFPLDSKDGPWWGNAMADVVTYADLLAARFGIDLGLAVAAKFNEVSERVGSDLRLDEGVSRK